MTELDAFKALVTVYLVVIGAISAGIVICAWVDHQRNQ